MLVFELIMKRLAGLGRYLGLLVCTIFLILWSILSSICEQLSVDLLGIKSEAIKSREKLPTNDKLLFCFTHWL